MAKLQSVFKTDITDEEREGNVVKFNLFGRLFTTLRDRGIRTDELEVTLVATLNQIGSMAQSDDVIVLPDGSRFIFQSGPQHV